MQQKIQTRIAELRKEYKKGDERVSTLEQELLSIQQSMLRINGAIQVLEELLALANESSTTQQHEASTDPVDLSSMADNGET